VSCFGAKSWICGRIGFDEDGERLIKICEGEGVNTCFVIRSELVPTTTKTRVLAGYQQIVRIDNEECEPLSEHDQKKVLRHLESFLAYEGKKVVILSDYQKGVLPRELVIQTIALCNAANVPVVTDPKTTDVSRYAGSTIVKPNLKDGREILRAMKPCLSPVSFDQETELMCQCYLESGIRNVVLSLSERGALIMGRDVPQATRLAPQVLQVADVSGAGDTMVAFLAMALASDFSIENAVRVGNVAAGIACGKPGTATVSLSEFLEAARERIPEAQQSRLLSLSELVAVVEREREAGKKIVFTNGCFDILHAGHVKVLQQSRSFGDILVVALNSDASVQRLKGPTRPIQNELDRAQILEALACVDFVTLFDDDTPLNIIQAIVPDVLVKGGDYSVNDIVGAKEVLAAGGRVEVVPLVEGRSTTSIVQRSGTSRNAT
jgi:D-beta-D-heptose 7-phosphate kinase/D-beta-D-heptose 1-phosphate adenosyltransferase